VTGHVRGTLVLVIVAAVLLPGCGSDGESVSGWLASDATSVIFLRWTRTGDSVTGTLRFANLDGEEVEASDSSFTGSISGGDISLTVGGFFGGRTLTGTLDDERLTLLLPDESGLLIPVEFRPSTVEAFNGLVGDLSAEAEAARAARQEREATDAAHKELDDATQRLRQALNGVNARPMREAVEEAERRLDKDVEAAIANLEATGEDVDQHEFGKQDVEFALMDVGFALDDVGFAVDDARGLFGEEAVRDALASLDEAVAAVRRADAEVRSLVGGERPQVQSLTDQAEQRSSEAEAELADLRARLDALTERARERWEYAVSVAESAGVEVEDRSGFGRE
jgi:hypothetical protein